MKIDPDMRIAQLTEEMTEPTERGIFLDMLLETDYEDTNDVPDAVWDEMAEKAYDKATRGEW